MSTVTPEIRNEEARLKVISEITEAIYDASCARDYSTARAFTRLLTDEAFDGLESGDNCAMQDLSRAYLQCLRTQLAAAYSRKEACEGHMRMLEGKIRWTEQNGEVQS